MGKDPAKGAASSETPIKADRDESLATVRAFLKATQPLAKKAAVDSAKATGGAAPKKPAAAGAKNKAEEGAKGAATAPPNKKKPVRKGTEYPAAGARRTSEEMATT